LARAGQRIGAKSPNGTNNSTFPPIWTAAASESTELVTCLHAERNGIKSRLRPPSLPEGTSEIARGPAIARMVRPSRTLVAHASPDGLRLERQMASPATTMAVARRTIGPTITALRNARRT